MCLHTMKCLTLISAGARINGPRDFLAPGGVYHPEPLRAIEPKDLPDDWLALPEAFLREYGQFRYLVATSMEHITRPPTA